MRASLEALKRSPSYEEFLKNKDNLVRRIRKENAAAKYVKFNVPPKAKPPKQKSDARTKLSVPREVENELSPYNINQITRLNWLKNELNSLPSYLKPNVNALFYYKFQDRIYVPEKEECIGLPDLGQIKKLQEERNEKRENTVSGEEEESEDYFKLPNWAEEDIAQIKKNPAGIYDLTNEDFRFELMKCTNKEQIKTIIAMGTEKLLLWLKSRDAVLRLEEGDRVREKLKAEGRWKEFNEIEPPPPKVTSEEKDKLMELILRQSEHLMLYDIFYNSGCPNKLPKRKLKQRTRLPLIYEEPQEKNKKAGTSALPIRYTLPYWAFNELQEVMNEKQLQTADEEAIRCLTVFLQMPKCTRKLEVQKWMEKEKNKMLKYLKVMKKIRTVDVLPPPKENIAWEEYRPESLKETFLQRIQAERKKKLEMDFQGVDIEEDYAGNGTHQKLREKMILEENILKMEHKLREYDKYLKSVQEVVTTRKVHPVPKFEIPPGMTDINPQHYSIVEGRPISAYSFNKTEYLNSMKRVFLTNLIRGLNDDNDEMKEQRNLCHIHYLLQVLDEIEYYTEAFSIYLFENQEDLMVNTRVFLDIGRLVVVKEAEILEAQKVLDIQKAALLSLGGLLKFRRLCHTILYNLAPYEWRSEYDRQKKKLQPLADQAADDVLNHLAFFKMNVLVQQPFLENLIIFLVNTIRNLGPPANYFKSSFEIDLAIRQLELENLNALQTISHAISQREKLEIAKEELINDCNKQITALEILIDTMMKQLNPKVEHVKQINKRSAQLSYYYWREVCTNKELLKANVHVKSLFDEFIYDEDVSPKDTLEMIRRLTEDIIVTHMNVSNIPKKEKNEIFNLLRHKDSIKFDRAERAMMLKINTEKLLRNMKRSYGISVGQQGHPVRFRSMNSPENCRKETKYQVAESNIEKTIETPVSHQIMKRILNLFEPTNQDDALMDTLVAFERIREKERCQQFVSVFRDASQSSGSDFEEESQPPETPLDVESSDESLVGLKMDQIDRQFVSQLKHLPESDSTSTLSEVVPSISEEPQEKLK